MSNTPVPVPKPDNVLAFPKTLPEVLYEPGKTIVDFDQEVDTAFIILEGNVNVFIRVMERVAKGRDIEVVRQEPIYEIGPGGVINTELFTKDGSNGFESPVKIVTRRATRLLAITLDDLTDPAIPEGKRLMRTRIVNDALAEALVKSELKRQVHRIDEDAVNHRIDDERDKRNEITKKFVEMQARAFKAESEIEAGKQFDPKQFWSEVSEQELDQVIELLAEDTAVTFR